MKQFILKPAFLILVFLVVSAIVGASTNACDKKIVTKHILFRKQTEPKKGPEAAAETGTYTDFILTNSILRF